MKSIARALAIAALLGSPRPLMASEALYLGWDDCRSGSGGANLMFACDANDQIYDLVVAFQPPADIADVIGMIAVVDVQHSATVLPDWWQMQPGGCRSNELLAGADFTMITDCVDPWAGTAGALIQGYEPAPPGGGARARIKAVAGVVSSQSVSLSGNSIYYALRIRFRTGRTSGGTACAGCLQPACLVLNGLRIQQGNGTEVLIETPAAGNLNWATWRGGSGADCALVPAKRSTWGQLKALYR